MRWTLYCILVVLCGIYENLMEMTDNLSFGIVLALCVRGLALMMDYFNKRKRWIHEAKKN